MDATELQRLTVACRLTGESLVDGLRKIEGEIRSKFQLVNGAYSALRREAIQEATEKIDASLADEAAEVKKLRDELHEVEKLVMDTRVSESSKKGYQRGDVKWPVGTKLQKNGKYGILEVYGPDTLLPEKLSSWKVPSFGGFFVRIYKKDGTPGIRIDESVYGWELAK